MGNFSRVDTFNRLKHYVGVRLQQGVPIVDADWNEMEDIRKYELQAFLKWFVGNGVPKGNNGFLIEAIANRENDFTIQGHGHDTPSQGVGRCLVEGWDVLNEKGIPYTEQELYIKPALADKWGVDPLPPLTPPSPTGPATRTDQVYLDVWEREVNAEEDEELINPAIGQATCVRLKREWVVRVVEDKSSIPDATDGHAFYHLATLTRPAGQDAIHITDRRVEIAIPSAADIRQIAADAFGTTYALDGDRDPKLKVSLREAVNALLVGEVPGTREQPLNIKGGSHPFAVRGNGGDLWLFYTSNQAAKARICYKRYNPATHTWGSESLVSTDNSKNFVDPIAVKHNNGDMWVFWYEDQTATGHSSIWYDHYSHAFERWNGNNLLTTTNLPPQYHRLSAVLYSGAIVVFFTSHKDANNAHIGYRTVGPGGSSGPDQVAVVGLSESPMAVVGDNVWLFFSYYPTSGFDIGYRRFNPFNPSHDQQLQPLTADAGAAEDKYAFPLRDRRGNTWVFWNSQKDNKRFILYRVGDGSQWSAPVQLTAGAESSNFPFAVEDSRGNIWLFWTSGNPQRIWYRRYTVEGWGREVQLSTANESDSQTNDHAPFALLDNEGDIWVFWSRSTPDTGTDIWYRKMITTLEGSNHG